MSHNNKKIRVLTLCLLGLVGNSAIKPAIAEESSAIQALMDQASYWHSHAHNELAVESLQKILQIDSHNKFALYRLALWDLEQNNLQAAQQWRDRLASIPESESLLQKLDDQIALNELPHEQVALARQQAQKGDIDSSLATWQKIFNGNNPPQSLIPEYYLTMAGSQSLYAQAKQSLQQASVRYPANLAVQVAYGKILTYRPQTRRQGIEILEKNAPQDPDADISLHQALLWLNPKISDRHFYENWLKRHPDDIEVTHYFHNHIGNASKSAGFEALNNNQPTRAITLFKQAIAINPTDPETLAGMGYALMRQGKYEQASLNFHQAILNAQKKPGKQDPELISKATFYETFTKAKQLDQQGHPDQALSMIQPLTQESGELGITAQLFQVDLLEGQQNYEDAQTILQQILTKDPANSDAQQSLYYLLQSQKKNAQAKDVLQSLPSSVRQSIQLQNGYITVRENANKAVQNGEIEKASAILLKGLNRYPNNPWLRLDLARLMEKQGRTAEMSSIIDPLYDKEASNEAIYAAALFASEHSDWDQVDVLLSRIPKTARTPAMQQLIQRSTFQKNIAKADQALKQGNIATALNLLQPLKTPDSIADIGRLALLLSQAGNQKRAALLVKQSINKGIQGNAGDYAPYMTVLEQIGDDDAAKALLASHEIQQNSTPEQLTTLRNIYVINQADRLREQQQYAQSYDLLARALQRSPKDSELMLAMARLYQSGKMNKRASQVYDYLLSQDPHNKGARIGAINIALSNHHPHKAAQLASQLEDQQSPNQLLLLARVADANGEHQNALNYLRQARGKLLHLEPNDLSTSPVIDGLIMADNPFITNADTVKLSSPTTHRTILPWQVPPLHQDAQNDRFANQRTDVPIESTTATTLREVNRLLKNVNRQTSSWVQGKVEVTGKNGEKGLSQLTTIKAPVKLSTLPTPNTRLDFTITPVSIDAGTSSDESSRRFGSGALLQGMEGALGIEGDPYTHVPSQGSQDDHGIEVNAALSHDNYQADIGSTPLGFEFETVVGGIQWSPQLTSYSKLTLLAQRRAVTDSLLSYGGAKDRFLGRSWGGVTKNGGSIEYSFDNGDIGYYVTAGGWRYLGHHVRTNSSFDANAGFYTRPINDHDRQVQAGVNIGYMDFSRNLSHFTFGQGGYFSPQHYISLSLPVEYTQQFPRTDLTLGGAIGYQSYNEDSSDYYPNNPDMQAALEVFAADDQTPEDNFKSESHAGVGYNLHAQLNYQVSDTVQLGGNLGYDTFGNYNQYTGYLWLRRSLESL